ncbi:MAG TPA: gliding motility-associated C-terminal domain-containing protein [Brumimicrobium sp.]|nr:gliding motility-associated C-terminal domain-containing protein [Brumimicrobium sp.]
MKNIFYILLYSCLLVFTTNTSYATQILGGEITWNCQGNNEYVFEMKLYRDCNGDIANTGQENLTVWGHSTLTTLVLNYIEKRDISPTCTAASGNNPLDCGTGANGGNGIGAIEEVTYRSNPVIIIGNTPSSGLHFTYQTQERRASITNLQNPEDNGMTLTASMFPIPGSAGGCINASPTFLQAPHFVSCAGNSYSYNPTGVDNDLDSLVYKWGTLLNDFSSGSFTPPTNPVPTSFVAGYDFNNPTPDASFNPSNVPASIDSKTGAIQFNTATPGHFAYKIVVESYYQGVKIASTERESIFFVENCSGTNNPPNVTPPFAGGTSFETTITAGDLLNFSLHASDFDNLQNGNSQTIRISTHGAMYGTNFTNPNDGCSTLPCATTDSGPSISAINDATLNVNWQTSCDHLLDGDGVAQTQKSYDFIFKVEDDYCPIPQVKYVTVTVHVENLDILPPPVIKCVKTDNNGDLIVEWETITDPYGTFMGYEINGTNGGSYGVISNINTGVFALPGGINTEENFFISTLSGCSGNTKRHSDTLSNLFLELDNPGNGEAILNWNQPAPNLDGEFQIFKEFPAGTWDLISTVPYSVTSYRDTITVCEEFINYRISLSTPDCDFTSNVAGDVFKDKIVPSIPTITNVNIDTLTGDVSVNWDVNRQTDTYGYVVYQTDANGNLIEIDTVWGRQNTQFSHYQNPENGPYQYSVAAFDSCYTSNIPPTYQTSAKANPHTSIFLATSLNVCERQMHFNWTAYEGFDNINAYHIFIKTNDGTWQQVGQTNALSYTLTISVGDEVISAVQAINDQGVSSFSNIDTLSFVGNYEPAISYLAVATVVNDHIEVKHRTSLGDGVDKVELERFNPRNQSFEKIDEQWVGNESEIIFKDTDVEVDKYTYTYRTRVVDTCAQSLGYSNIGRTMFLDVLTNDTEEIHVLQWSPYTEFTGNLYSYEIYRALDGEFESTPLATLPHNERTYTDYVTNIGDFDDGKICYLVVAVEGGNQYGWRERSFSNEACGIIKPTIFIPNAFTVGGENPVFKPETRQHQYDDYLFEVYDRYGRIIFSTTQPDEGWDGYIKDHKRVAREGVYIYRLAVRDGNGIEVLKHGHVTLLDYTK